MNLICFSDVPWKQNHPRTKFILGCFSNHYVTYYVEEFVLNDQDDGYDLNITKEGVLVISPHLLSENCSGRDARASKIIKDFLSEEGISEYVFWYYTPTVFNFTKGFKPKLSIYDCIDEQKAFSFIDDQAKNLRLQLSDKADIVFEGTKTDGSVNQTAWILIYLKMQKIIKNRLEGKEMMKIVRLPRLSDNMKLNSMQSFGK